MDTSAIKIGADGVARYDPDLAREGNIRRIAEKVLITLAADNDLKAYEAVRMAFVIAETFVEECERRDGG